MIFDRHAVTKLVLEWQRTKSVATLERILEQSRNLIEAIVSGYDSTFRDDLIQESYIRLHYAAQFYNPKFNLHSYFTTVIHNICRTYIKKNTRELRMYGNHYATHTITHVDDESVAEDLIIRNRLRFPSLPVSCIDDMSEFIIMALKDGSYGRSSRIISELSDRFNIDRNLVKVVVQSSIIFLRSKYITHSHTIVKYEEFSIMADLKEIMGDRIYMHIAAIFSGMNIKVP